MLRRIASRLSMVVVTMLIAGFFGATLVRLAPGFGQDARELNYQLSAESKALHRAELQKNGNILKFYVRYLVALASGDLGHSTAFNRPVKQLLAERLPATAAAVGTALLIAWVAGLGFAVIATLPGSAALDHIFGTASSTLLCIPAAVLGLLFLFFGAPPAMAIGFLVLPKVYRFSANLLRSSYELPHIITARAKGLPESQVLLWHVMPTAAPQLFALAGVSVPLALSASLPIEVICDIAGIGQLAWSAAQARDLTLLVSLTLVIALVTSIATAFSELADRELQRRPA